MPKAEPGDSTAMQQKQTHQGHLEAAYEAQGQYERFPGGGKHGQCFWVLEAGDTGTLGRKVLSVTKAPCAEDGIASVRRR